MVDKSERMDQIVRKGFDENDWMDSAKSAIISLSEWGQSYYDWSL